MGHGRGRLRALGVLLLTLVIGGGLASTAEAASQRWVAGWAGSPMGVGSTSQYPSGFADKTVRNIIHPATSGNRVRFRISNEWGSKPLRISAAQLAKRSSGANVDPLSGAKLRFGGASGITIPVGEVALTDELSYPVTFGQDLAVSLYTPDPTGRPTFHFSANSTSYIGSGNRVDQSHGTGFGAITSWYFLTQMLLVSTDDLGTVVAFGDSITDGSFSTRDANNRYTDYLADRLAARPVGRQLSVVNAGIGSNRLLDDNYQTSRHIPSGLERFEQDVLSVPNLRAVIMLMGTNDLSPANPRNVTTTELITGYNVIIAKARQKGATTVVGTMPPGFCLRRTEPIAEQQRCENLRREVNNWIRNTDRIDTVVDFDAVLRDPADPTRIRPAFRGDEVHPNDAGYRAMASYIPLSAIGG